MEQDETRLSSEQSSDRDDDESSGSETELMVTTRERRTTAGNRYSGLVAQEQAIEDEEDEVALLFAEGDEEDDEFQSDAAADDADMSSSDDDDQGPDAGAEDLEGEKEIQKQAKDEKAKKRKADMAMTSIAGLKKKPKIDPTSLNRAVAPKPTKRKERVSWIPDQGLSKGRTSLRAQTIAHRAETHAKLKVNEAQRLKMKARRQEREKLREAEAPKQLTQADRLAEAGRIERKNAKSLNRWETMEKKRAEEQAAKLAALKDRKLHGAVVTWYSSSAKYIGLKREDNIGETTTEVKKRGRKPKAFHEQMAAAKLAEANALSNAQNQTLLSASADTSRTPTVNDSQSIIVITSQQPQEAGMAAKENDDSFLTGIHEYASMDIDTKETSPRSADQNIDVESSLTNSATTVQQQSSILETEHEPAKSSATESGSELPKQDGEPTDRSESAAPIQNSMVEQSPKSRELSLLLKNKDIAEAENSPVEALSQPPPPPDATELRTSAEPGTDLRSTPPIEVVSTRNLVILDRFDDLPGNAKNDFSLFYNNRKTTKPSKHVPELCPITGLVARYRDPLTGIGYANATAFKKLQDLRKHYSTWSSMLGCYVGRSTLIARGVPEGFLG